jgi:hypothetical protein
MMAFFLFDVAEERSEVVLIDDGTDLPAKNVTLIMMTVCS